MKPSAEAGWPGNAPGASRRFGVVGRLTERFLNWRNALVSSPRFQEFAARAPLFSLFARRDAERLFDLTAGFVYSQILFACVETGVLDALRRGPLFADDLRTRIGAPPERCESLLQGAAAIGVLQRLSDGRYALGRLGAAAIGAPGVTAMIRHHRLFYRDLTDPVALLQGRTSPELARYWAYVAGADAPSDAAAREYSELMAASQVLVAEETLNVAPLRGARQLLDIGGGAGVFAQAAAARWPDLQVALFDLPAVADEAERRFADAGLIGRASAYGGDFHADPLPQGADALSLVRVLYDHDDAAVEALLARSCEALSPGGLLIVSEPMSGGRKPSRAGDAYFGLYTTAMTSGRPRSAARHCELLRRAGFRDARPLPTRRPFITSVVVARAPSGPQT